MLFILFTHYSPLSLITLFPSRSLLDCCCQEEHTDQGMYISCIAVATANNDNDNVGGSPQQEETNN
jgi:hypothetical protein